MVLAIGTRLMDFTTGSWTAFAPEAKFMSINAARWDATKHRALAVVGDALETVQELDAALGDWKATQPGPKRARAEFAEWNALLDGFQTPTQRAGADLCAGGRRSSTRRRASATC